MHERTGEIRQFYDEALAKSQGFTVPVSRKPNPNCRKCYGRGYLGTGDTGMKVPCSCVGPKDYSEEPIKEAFKKG